MAINSATSTTPQSGATPSSPAKDGATLADNFQSFLKLLTTQLQHQDPSAPLDSNAFTEQLVQFAGIEQQLKSNAQLEKLIALEQAAQSSQALTFVGSNVTVDGSTARLDGEPGSLLTARWNVIAPPGTTQTTFTITDSSGREVYTQNLTLDQNLNFGWDGTGNDGTTKFPPGDYKLKVTGKDSDGKDVTISTEVTGKVVSVDLTTNPPLLSVNGKNYTVDKIKRVEAATPAPTPPKPAT